MLLTGGLLIAMGLARLADVDGLLTTLFRDRAYESGWYDARRPLQAVVVAALAAAWLSWWSVRAGGSPSGRDGTCR